MASGVACTAYAQTNLIDLTEEVGMTAQSWGVTGSAAAGYAPLAVSSDGRQYAMAETYASDVNSTGVKMEQTVTGLTAGTYQVTLYANACYTPNRGFSTNASEDDMGVAYVFVNGSTSSTTIQKTYIPVHFTESVTDSYGENGEYTFEVNVSDDGQLTMGLGKDRAGSNWETINIKSLYFVPDESSEVWLDVTDQYLTNPTFDGNSTTGWTLDIGTGNTGNGGRRDYNAFEVWNGTNWNFYQTLTGLPNGMYRVSCQGFYRPTANSNAAVRAYNNGNDVIQGYLYADNEEVKMKSVYSYSFAYNVGDTFSYGEYYYPNGMSSATSAFYLEAYPNSVEAEVTDGTLTIGVKRTGDWVDNNWCIFDDFKLEYLSTTNTNMYIEGITLSATSLGLEMGESAQLTYTTTPENPVFKKVTWSSSNESVAKVDANGLVTAMSKGIAVISCTANSGTGVSATAAVNVTRNPMTAENIVINELMPMNIDMYISPATNFDSWLELYNPTDKAVSLSNGYISDDASNLRKWMMPAEIGTIPANGYKVIWFDHTEVNNVQAPFRLDAAGDTVFISDESGELITSLIYPASVSRCSYARIYDGASTWGFTSTPTFEASNSGSTFATTQVAAPTVDTDAKLFTGSLSIKVTVPTGATLRYTTDGTLPTLTNGATSSNGSFTVNATTTYRFRSFQNGYLPSDVTARTYIMTSQEYTLPIISITTDPDFLYDNEIGIAVDGTNGIPGRGKTYNSNLNQDWERPVNFTYLIDNQTVFNQDVYMSIAGGWSRHWGPTPFKLKGNKMLGKKTLDYPFFANKPYIKNRTLQIRNSGNDSGCMVKDAILQRIIGTSGIDVDYQEYQPTVHFINGEYKGVINMREPNNKHFVEANCGWDDDLIDQFEIGPDSGYFQSVGTKEAFMELYNLSASAASDATYEQIKQLLDVDEYINYMALQLYMGNWDWPQNNVKGYRNRTDGKFRFVIYDLDGALNTTDVFNTFAGKQNYTFDTLYPSGERLTMEIEFVTIFLNLLNNETFRKQFIDTYCLAGGSVFTSSRVSEIANAIANKVDAPLELDGKDPWSTTNAIINGFSSSRLTNMITSLKSYSPMGLGSTAAQNVSFSSDTEGARFFLNGIPVPTDQFNGKLFYPATITVEAPVGYVFDGWEGSEETSNAIDLATSGGLSVVAKFKAMTATEKLDAHIYPVRVNEVSASNNRYVGDIWKRNDWVELYNTTGEPVDVEGMYLSDNINKPQKWQITKGATAANTIIPAHGHLIIWCDKEEAVNQLHATFKLNAAENYVMLTAADGSWSDTLRYAAHDEYYTVGRFPDGGNKVYKMNVQTIEKANTLSATSSVKFSEYVPAAALKGDADSNGVVDVNDVISILNYITGSIPSGFSFVNADMDENNSIEVSDVINIINMIIGE